MSIPKKTSVKWLEARTIQFYLIGSPSKTNLFMENQGKLVQGQKNAKIAIIEKETQQIHFYPNENDVKWFYLKRPL